ncbi:YjjG family noncanonical pyrimidine nucleotidase [Aquimarina sp. U1-2]|uniref:YjjG family noncanonical pyrimidine nucleotidase n=1 Tax=Aquimarina sp. U1-2 TaxID=2823141 RepID=UPI001AECA718|nr:YjjG family noncanonical pyrimidine nucleotidase [Aquimarina sp. U1-2]MBP2830962.1 YjjG family noncanonical pyrimidine nucleotidase [Aquimarina sp. U1-2]
MNSSIKHIFFDLDHTLWDFDKNSSLAFDRLFKKFEIKLDLVSFLQVYQPINLRYWKLYREEKVTKEELRRQRLIQAFDALGKEYALDLIDSMAQDYIAFLPLHNHLIDGALGLLEYLKPLYTLHIITNGFREVQNNKLERSGIKEFFTTVTNSEETGVKKPNPIIFEHAIKISGAAVENSVMIGDNYEADILGAQAVGLQTICFNYHQTELPLNNLQVSSLSEITKYL